MFNFAGLCIEVLVFKRLSKYKFDDPCRAETGFARCMGLCCPCVSKQQRDAEGAEGAAQGRTAETGPLQEFAQELPAANPLPGQVAPTVSSPKLGMSLSKIE